MQSILNDNYNSLMHILYRKFNITFRAGQNTRGTGISPVNQVNFSKNRELLGENYIVYYDERMSLS